jgi:MATH domain
VHVCKELIKLIILILGASHIFEDTKDWGFAQFVKLSDLQNGFLKDDILLVDVEIEVAGTSGLLHG